MKTDISNEVTIIPILYLFKMKILKLYSLIAVLF